MNRAEIKPQWQSLEEYSETGSHLLERSDEFPKGNDVLEVKPGVDRRNFLGIMSASMALTGTLLTGCLRKPSEKILPYVKRPEDLVPGESRYFATALQVVGQVYGVLVKSYDGRPIKIEGNPDHPGSLGATNHFGQAEVLSLYDPDRLTHPLANQKVVTLDSAKQSLTEMGVKFRQESGKGVAFLVDWVASPTFQSLLAKAQAEFPAAQFFLHDESHAANEARALRLLGLPQAKLAHSLKEAKVIFALDADPFGLEGETVRLNREFANARRVKDNTPSMNRLYSAESTFSITGAAADHRLLLTQGMIAELAIELARELDRRGAPIGGPGSGLVARLGQTSIMEKHSKWIKVLAEDLLANPGKSIVLVGDKQPDWVHALGFAINAALGNLGQTVQIFPDGSQVEFGSIAQLASNIQSGLVHSLILIGGNPAYTAPAEVGFSELIGRVQNSVYLGYDANETSAVSQLSVPLTHALEAWGDYHTYDGTVAVRQPLIAPLFQAISEIEFMSLLLGTNMQPYELVRQNFREKSQLADFELAWKNALNDGVAQHKAFVSLNAQPAYTELASVLPQLGAAELPTAESLDLLISRDFSVYDGRYSNNAWLQELPDPITKMTWDNALLLAPSTAQKLNLQRGDVVELSIGNASSRAAVFVQPGVAPFTAVLNLGYGRREVGRVGKGTGFATAAFRSTKSSYFVRGLALKKTSEKYLIATTQGHNSMEGRPLIRENTLTGFKTDPGFVNKYELMPVEKHKTMLWTEPNIKTGQQWGMTIDLNSCTGCNTCVLACQSENNIAVVGKKEVDRNREMSWIRIDRYFSGDPEDPQVLNQPVNCMHCETAPCEGVCPVGATIHSPEGMNDMAYNRCIGTRYCSNNCPFKVRKFNYFNFSKRQDEMNPLVAMQQNPNVTVRFRGVIEKCSYCVQRVNKARIDAKVHGDGLIQDGAVQTACQQACPTGAIEFGDINQPHSRVAAAKAQPRNYAMLGELNIRPRTTYLAKLRNPHANLV